MTRIKLCSMGHCTYPRVLAVGVILLSLNKLYSHFQTPSSSPYISHSIYPRVVIAIIADWHEMNARVKASKDTWVSQLSYDIFYFVGVSSELNETFVNESNVIVLPYDDHEYPPINKTFAMWRYIYENHAREYDYFVAADTDTYVNVKQLEKMIKSLKCENCYIGYQGFGRVPASQLGLHGPYCLGMGYVLSRYTLLQFGPHVDTCRTSIFAKHSDTEMGRCIYKYAHNLSCSVSPIPFGPVWFTVNDKGEKVRLRLNEYQQMELDFPKSPPTRLFEAPMIHPLKRPQHFYRFHEQVTLGLRPVLSPVFAKGSCVANPTLQKEIYPKTGHLPECHSTKINRSAAIESLPAYTLALPGFDKRVQTVVQLFNQHGLRVKHFVSVNYATSFRSENDLNAHRGLRMIMTDFFRKATQKKFIRVLVLEDNAVPHRQLGSLLKLALEDSRCGQYMLDDLSGGLMMLGATVNEEGWTTLEQLGMNETGSCKNICSKVTGSFAVIYHRVTFETILNWLNTTTDEPYHRVFTHLSRLGFPVRFMHPNLVIKDLRLESPIQQSLNGSIMNDSEKTADIYRWVLADYMIS